MVSKYGVEITEWLLSEEGKTYRYTDEELKSIKDEYRDKIRRLESGEAPKDHKRMAVSSVFEDMGTPREVS
jgi:hypothetical protein